MVISILIAGFQDFNLMLYIAIGLFKVEWLEKDEETQKKEGKESEELLLGTCQKLKVYLLS